jgi:hypothetical protein
VAPVARAMAERLAGKSRTVRRENPASGVTMARRNVFDPLEPTREPRWYVVRAARNALTRVDRRGLEAR